VFLEHLLDKLEL